MMGVLVMGERNVAVQGDVRDSTIITGDSNMVVRRRRMRRVQVKRR